MNKRLASLLLAILLLLPLTPSALAQDGAFCDPIPDELLAFLLESISPETIVDHIAFTLSSGESVSFVISDSTLMRCQKRDGVWALDTLLVPCQARFVRHDSSTPRADGSFYPDALGFDLIDERGEQLSFRLKQTDLVLCGWKNTAIYDGEAILNGLTVSYYPTGQTAPEATYQLPQGFEGVMEYRFLPATPADAARIVSISREAVADRFDGYTLQDYRASYDCGEASASYARVEDGMLLVLRAQFSALAAQPSTEECMLVPLSPALLARLETEELGTLLNVAANSDLFLTQDAYDPQQIPVSGKLFSSALQKDALLLLTEDEAGVRRLSIVQREEGTYTVQTTPALPSGISLDIFHASSGGVQLEWTLPPSEAPVYRSAAYSHMADDSWQLAWSMGSGDDAPNYTTVFFGVQQEYSHGSTDGILIGTVPHADLLRDGVDELPQTESELIETLDRSGWAVVNNDDPADRLHLRTSPERGARSLGKFYNRTPVRVLREQGDWCEVAIGLDGHLTGWMMKRYLAFGDDIAAVRCAFPQLYVRDEYNTHPLYADQALTKTSNAAGGGWVIGVVEDELYIVLTETGATAYAPQDWFAVGNG